MATDSSWWNASGIAGIKTENSNVQETKREDESNANNQNQAEAELNEMIIDDDSDDSDVQIISDEPEIIQIDDMSDELERLRWTWQNYAITTVNMFHVVNVMSLNPFSIFYIIKGFIDLFTWVLPLQRCHILKNYIFFSLLNPQDPEPTSDEWS